MTVGGVGTASLAVSESVSVTGTYFQNTVNSTLTLTLAGTLNSRAAFLTAGGILILSGTGITVSGTNTAFAGTWNITGSGTVKAEENLGTDSAVELAATGALTLTGAAWNFNHALTGSGALVVSLDAATDAFNFGADTGTAFEGTLTLTSGSYHLSDPASANLTALARATLTLDGGLVTLGAADGLAVGNLTLRGGTFNTVMATPNTVHTLTVTTLSVAGGAATVVNLDGAPLAAPAPLPPTGNLIDQANVGNAGIQVVAATNVDQAGAHLALTLDGAAPARQTFTVSDGAGHAVGATYEYTAVTSGGAEHPAGAGLYVDYLLRELETRGDLLLDTAGATYSTFGAAVTGSGNVEFNARAGTLALTGSNSYTGATKLAGGTLQVDTANPLFAASGALAIDVDATLDLNGHDLQVNNLTGAGLANFVDATLTVTSTVDTVFTGTLNGGVLAKTGAAQLDADSATAALTQVQVAAGELKLGADATVSGGGDEPAVLLTGGTATFNGSHLTTDSGTLIAARDTATVNLIDLTVSATSPGASLIRVEEGTLTVNLNRSAATGDLSVAGGASGRVTLSGNSALTGRLDAVEVVIDTTSQLNLTGDSSLTGLANNGMVEFVTDGGYKTLTLTNLTGNGTFSLNVSVKELVTDYVTVSGAASGDHQVIIKRDAADLDASVTHLELAMFGIDPALSDATFHGETDIGTRVASLQLGDLSGQHLDQWFLVLNSGDSNARHGILASAAMRELAWFANDTLVKRLGELRLGSARSHANRSLGTGHDWDVWVRGYGAQTDVGGAVSGHRFKLTSHGSDLGTDKVWLLDRRNTVFTGVFGGYDKTD
ncbi:MAG: hypothetical protein LBK60_08220, partial [Verrucomicrobiales bacterium]|nr:hypothetical protein [Verrucomicrobiales bacterium]